MRKLTYFAFLICILIITGSCGSNKMISTQTKSDEAIIFGKITFTGKDSFDSSKILLHFNERLWGKYAVWVDENNYFYIKLPLGENHLALLEYTKGSGFYKNIPNGYLSFNLSDPNKIYYIGDIIINWTLSDKDRRKQGGAIGVIDEARKKGDFFPVEISASEASIDHFKKKFPENEKEIVTQLLSTSK